MKIKAYRIDESSSNMEIRKGNRQRNWMDDTISKYAYRCLPLTIANCTGWDLYAPCDFIVSWNGGNHQSDMTINYEKDDMHFCGSGFGCGILTFHSGYIFKTSPEWNIMCTAPINEVIDWATPLTGIVETWWLNFTFTINWKLNKPGTYKHDCKIPVARIIPIPHNPIIETSMCVLSDNQIIDDEYNDWVDDRQQLLDDIDQSFSTQQDTGKVKLDEPKTHWEKTYYTGKDKSGQRINNHIIKKEYPDFVDLDEELYEK